MVGERIRKLRKERDWTQRELNEKTGVDPKNISSYESGRLVPSKRTLKRFADAFGVTVEDLLAEESQQPSLAITDPEMLNLFKEISRLPEKDQGHIKWVLQMAVRQSRIQAMMAS